MSDFGGCIIFLLAKAYQKAHGVLRRRLADFGITPIQHLVLEAVGEEEGLSAGEIGKRVALDSATLSGVLDRLEEAGWIAKQVDEVDRRILRVFLTAKARETLPALVEQRKGANVEVLGGLTEEEQVLLRHLLRNLRG